MEEHHCSYVENKHNILIRLRKIEGQIKGIQKMVEKEDYCVDVLTQIAAARAALDKVNLLIFEDHIRGCVAEALKNNSGAEKISEVINIIRKFIK